jgi:hypothetical protein
MSTLTVTKNHGAWLDAKTLLGFVIATGLGVFVAAYPLVGLGGVGACLALFGISRWCRGRLELWQAFVLLAMTPYVVLNYGFDNLTVGTGGLRLPVGELLMFLALASVVLGRQRTLVHSMLLDPPVVCLTVLLLLTCAHLAVDVPRYGLYAVRDSSMFFEAAFLILGVIWGRNLRSTQLLMRWLFFIFVLNLLYSYTFPWGDQIQAVSPVSGVFHAVPFIGNYQMSALFLVLGALYCIWVGPSVVRWPRWSLVLLAVAQLGGLAILQVRAMYVGIVLVFVILLLLRETKKLVGLATTLGLGFATLLVMLSAVSLTGIKLQGRMGPVDFSFIEQHAKTVLALGDPNARMSHDVDRGDWYQEVWDRVRSSPSNLAIGVGFGQVLIDFENEQGIPVRQPHNSSLTVLARLGFGGLSIWLVFVGMVIVRYVRFLRTPYITAGVSTVVLWLFLQFILTLLDASVQPSLEFSHGAIPFYFLLGLGFATMRGSYDNSDLRRSEVGEPQGTDQ